MRAEMNWKKSAEPFLNGVVTFGTMNRQTAPSTVLKYPRRPRLENAISSTEFIQHMFAHRFN